MSHWDRLPEEVEAHIWKLYFRTHVLPDIRHFPSQRWLRRLVRSLRGYGSRSKRARDSLTIWTELIACHWRTLDEARVQLESAFPETTVYKDYDDGTTKLFWTYRPNDGDKGDEEGEHVFSAMQDSDRYYLSYHGPTRYETVIVDARSNEMHSHSRLVSSKITNRRPKVRTWNQQHFERRSLETPTTLSWV